MQKHVQVEVGEAEGVVQAVGELGVGVADERAVLGVDDAVVVQVLEADVAGGRAALRGVVFHVFLGLKQAVGHQAVERAKRLALVVAHNHAAQRAQAVVGLAVAQRFEAGFVGRQRQVGRPVEARGAALHVARGQGEVDAAVVSRGGVAVHAFECARHQRHRHRRNQVWRGAVVEVKRGLEAVLQEAYVDANVRLVVGFPAQPGVGQARGRGARQNGAVGPKRVLNARVDGVEVGKAASIVGVAHFAVAYAQLQVADEGVILEETFLRNPPAGRNAGEETELVAGREVARAVVAGHQLQQVLAGEVVVQASEIAGQVRSGVDTARVGQRQVQRARVDDLQVVVQVARAVGFHVAVVECLRRLAQQQRYLVLAGKQVVVGRRVLDEVARRVARRSRRARSGLRVARGVHIVAHAQLGHAGPESVEVVKNEVGAHVGAQA